MPSHRRRYLVCIPDGAADPVDGASALAAATMPTLHRLARQGVVGRARTIPPGMPAASDVGMMAILGYDPVRQHTGRAPIEAAALGVDMRPDRVAFRCNLVTVAEDGTMIDFAGGHPTQSAARLAMARLDAATPREVTFHHGLGYRNVMLAPAVWVNAICPLPHEVMGVRPDPPRGPGAESLCRIMTRSREVLRDMDIAANQVWLWGQGRAPALDRLTERLHVAGTMVAAVTIARGLGRLAGLDVPDVPGATGWYNTSYESKRDAAIAAFDHGADLVVVHVAATDEAGHAGDMAAKVQALEHWDARLLAGLCEYLDATGPWRLLWIPDHVTDVQTRMHTAEAVPYVRFDSDRTAVASADRTAATTAARHTPVDGRTLLPALVGG